MLLSGASRDQIRDELIKLAKGFIEMVKREEEKDQIVLVHEIREENSDDQILMLQTYEIPYRSTIGYGQSNPLSTSSLASEKVFVLPNYDPTPPLTLQETELKVYVTRASVPLLTIENFTSYQAVNISKMKTRNRHASGSRVIDSDISVHILEDESKGDYPMTIIMKINMPFMYAPRVIVNTHYKLFEKDTRRLTSVSSSILNEMIRDENMVKKDDTTAALINDEVVAFNHINYMLVETPETEEPEERKQKHRPHLSDAPYNWYQVYCFDVGGMVAKKFLDKLKVSRQLQGELLIRQILKTVAEKKK